MNLVSVYAESVYPSIGPNIRIHCTAAVMQNVLDTWSLFITMNYKRCVNVILVARRNDGYRGLGVPYSERLRLNLCRNQDFS